MEDAVANQEVARSEEASTPRARATVVKEPPTAWPATGDGEHTLPPPTREAEARALAHAVAVAPCVAHVRDDAKRPSLCRLRTARSTSLSDWSPPRPLAAPAPPRVDARGWSLLYLRTIPTF